MTFHWPHAFWLLIVPIFFVVRDLLRRRLAADTHPKILHAEARRSSLVLGGAARRRGGKRVRVWLGLAFVASTVALARPQWGRIEEPVFDQSREIIIALDLSRSMLAEDVKPSRLERARLLITSLLERLKGERVGLIVFSGTAFLQSPLSADYEILREFLPLLNPGYLPEGGTNYDALLETTLSAFGDSASADRFLIVLSDGEALTDTWSKHLSAMKTKEIRVIGLGIGTEEGSLIPDGSGSFIKDERGAVVLSKLNGATLRELAEKTNGAYADASSWIDLSQLIQETVERGRRGTFTETNRVRLAERFQWPLAAAVALFLLSLWREFPVRPKPRSLRLASSARTVVALGCLVPGLSFIGPDAFAADTATPSPTSAITKIIGHIASLEKPAARDYADLARATIVFGESLQEAQKPVPEGPVRDALAATDAGEALDAKAAAWAELRQRLNALLPKDTPPPPQQDPSQPDEQKPEQNKKDSSDSKDSSSDQNPKGDSSESGEGEQKDDASRQPQSKPDSSKSENDDQSAGGENRSDSRSQPDDPKNNKPSSSSSNAPQQSAFGDMNQDQSAEPENKPPAPAPSPDKNEPTQEPESEMQQVGGTSASPSTDPARLDPSLAIPMQKLDQIKQNDSPAELFQLLQGPVEQPASTGRNW